MSTTITPSPTRTASARGYQYPLSEPAAYSILYASLGVFAATAFAFHLYTSSKQRNSSKNDDFYSARGRFSWGWIAMSYFSSGMGAWVVYAAPEVGTFLGWWGVLGYAIAAIFPMCILLSLGVRISDRMALYGDGKGFAVTDWVRARFGRTMQVYTALVSFFYMWISMVAEYTAVGQVVNAFSGIPVWLTTLSLAIVTLTYTLGAGLPVSIFTDMLQGIFALCLIAFAIVAAAGEVRVTEENWNQVATWTTLGFESFITLVLAIISAELFNMVVWQRVFAARNTRHLRQGLIAGSCLVFLTMLGFGGLGMLAQAQDQGRAEPHLTFDPYTKYLAFFDLLLPLAPVSVGFVAILAVCLVASTIDSLQNGLLSLFAKEFEARDVNINFARLLLVCVNVPAVILAMEELSVLNLFLIADLLAATACLPVFMGLHTATTTLGAMCGIGTANFSILCYGWVYTGTFVGGFEMYLLKDGLYSSVAMEVFLIVMSTSFVVTLLVSALQLGLFPASEGLCAWGRTTPHVDMMPVGEGLSFPVETDEGHLAVEIVK